MGHTYEDVDAGFSKIASNLRKNDCETLEELKKLLPNSKYFNYLFDVRISVESHLVDLSKHTQPLHYKFVRNAESVNILYKGTQTQPSKKLKSSLFKSNSKGIPSLPTGAQDLSKKHMNTSI